MKQESKPKSKGIPVKMENTVGNASPTHPEITKLTIILEKFMDSIEIQGSSKIMMAAEILRLNTIIAKNYVKLPANIDVHSGS